MLDQDADEPLHGPQDHPVDHYRPMLFPVRSDIGKLEPIRHGKVDLDRRALPLPPEGVFQLDVDLGAVKGPFPLVDLKGKVRSPPGPGAGPASPCSQSSSEPMDLSPAGC